MRIKSSEKILIGGSLIVILLLGMASWLIQDRLQSNAQREMEQSLRVVLQTTHQAIKSWVNDHKAVASMWANSAEVRQFTQQLLKSPRTRQALMASPIKNQSREHLSPALVGMGYQGFFIISPDFVNLASSRDENIGVKSLLIKQDKFFKNILSGKPVLSLPVKSDVPLTDASGVLQENLPTMFVGAPVLDRLGKPIAIFTFRLNPAEAFTKILQQGRIGATGETYAFDSEGRLISNSRYVDELRTIGLLAGDQLGILNIEIRDPGAQLNMDKTSKLLKQPRPLTRMAASAIAGESGSDLEGYRDYRGSSVIGTWLWDQDLGIGIATEQDKKEAYESIRNIRVVIVTLTILAIVLSIGLVMLHVFYSNMKLAVQQKSDSEARLRLLLESVGEGVFGVDLQGNCTFVNPTALRLLGYKNATDLVGKNIHPIIHHTKFDGEPCSDQECKIYSAYREGKSYFVDDELLWRVDGTSFEVEYRSNPIYHHGKISGSVASFSDITSRRQAEYALRKSEQKYRQVFNSILDVYAEIGLDGNILEISPSVKYQTGYTREELLGRFMGDFYANPGDREKLLARIHKDGMINDYEIDLVDKDGSVRPFSFTGKVVTDEKGQPLRLAGVMRDIADRKYTEDVLRNARDELEIRVRERTHELDNANIELKKEINERKQAAEILEQERRLFVAGPTVVFKWRAEESWPVEYVSPNIAEQFGYSPEDFTAGKVKFSDIIHQDDLGRVAEEVESYNAAGVPFFEQQYRIVDNNSKYHWIYDLTSVVRNEKDTITHYHGYIIDVTERKLAEDALRERERFIQTILDSLVDNIAVINKEGVIVSVNEAWQDFALTNRRAKLVHSKIGDNYLDVIRSTSKAGLEEANLALGGLESVLKGNIDKYSMEYACDCTNEKRWFVMHVTPYSADNSGVVVSHRNITNRKEAENAVRNERDKAQRYLDTVEAIIVSLNQVGEITLINRKGCELLGYSEDELLGKNWFGTCLPQPEGLEVVYPVFREIMDGKLETAEYYENSVLTSSGGKRLIAWHNSYFHDDEGGSIGTLSAGEDITDRVHAEDQARQHQADLAHMARLNIMGEMATGIAHELNQPLSAIATYSDVALRMLVTGTEQPDKLKEAILGSQSQARRAAEIIRHLRKLVSKQAPQKKEADISELIKESMNLVVTDTKKYRVKTKLEQDSDLPLVVVDPIQIEQVILNLVKNSIEAMHQVKNTARELTIRTEINGEDNIQVTVSDTGPGMDEQTKRQIFEPFVTTKEGAGMGMGLSISRSIIEAHHGNLWVESEPDQGASFFFTLPINKA